MNKKFMKTFAEKTNKSLNEETQKDIKGDAQIKERPIGI